MTLRGPQVLAMGWGVESTWGTAVTRTKFLPIISESLSYDKEPIEDEAIYAGELSRNIDQVGRGNKVVAGQIKLPLYSQGFRELLTQFFGAEGGAGPYTYSPADLEGDSLTIEIVRGGISATEAYVFEGCKFPKMVIEWSQGKQVTATFDVSAQACTTGVTPTAVSYPSGLNYAVAHSMTTTLTGSDAFNLKSGSLTFENGLVTDRYHSDSDQIKEQVEAGIRSYMASLTIELTSDQRITQQHAATEVDLGLTFPIDSGLGGAADSLAVAMNGELTKVGQGVQQRTGLIEETLEFKAAKSTGGAESTAVQLTYTTTEA